MKIKIAIPGSSIMTEMSEKEAGKAFRTLASALMDIQAGEADIKAPEPPRPLVSEDGEAPEPVTKKEPIATLNKPGPYLYKGFMYIACQKCGHVHAYCIKKEMGHAMCHECGEATRFTEPLKPVYMFCECGKQSQYMTNMTALGFDIECISCGSPVAVQYNRKKNCYETMGRG